jgi:hypothetical protein
VTDGGGSLVSAGRAAQHGPDRVLRVTAGDVDHAIDGVRPVERAARPADHLDLVDIFQQGRMQVPEYLRLKWSVDRSPVDQDEQLVGGFRAVEAARGDRILAGVDLLDLQVRREPEHFGQRRRSRGEDVILGDDVERRRRPAQRLLALGGGANGNLGQLLDRERRQIRVCRHVQRKVLGVRQRRQKQCHSAGQ